MIGLPPLRLLGLLCSLSIAALSLAGCGNDPLAAESALPFKAIAAGVKRLNNPADAQKDALARLDPASIAQLRTALEQDGQPITLVQHPSLHYANLMAVYGQNGPVQTWASEQYESVSLRDGMLIATRGFGKDLMAASAPTVGQIAAARGSVARRYSYLDGADQVVIHDYSCVLGPDGRESINVFGKTYATTRVAESCSGPSGSFTNTYWFDLGHKLRQSQQMVAPELQDMVLQRIID